jgi:hypothetical protein
MPRLASGKRLDGRFLDTLPARDRRAGKAEAVKVALVRDAAFFEWLEAVALRLAQVPRMQLLNRPVLIAFRGGRSLPESVCRARLRRDPGGDRVASPLHARSPQSARGARTWQEVGYMDRGDGGR